MKIQIPVGKEPLIEDLGYVNNLSLFKLRISFNFRSDCFSTEYFTSCVDALMLKETKKIYNEMVAVLG